MGCSMTALRFWGLEYARRMVSGEERSVIGSAKGSYVAGRLVIAGQLW